MKKNKLLIVLLAIFAVFAISGCSRKENEYARIALMDRADAVSLYVHGTAASKFSVKNAVYFCDDYDNYNETVYSMMQQQRAPINVAYFDYSDPTTKSFIDSHNDLTIIFIDNLTLTGEAKGVWVAYSDFIESHPKTLKSLLSSLVKSAISRDNNIKFNDNDVTYASYISDVVPTIQAALTSGNIYFKATNYTTKNNIHIHTSFYEHLAIYEYQLNDKNENYITDFAKFEDSLSFTFDKILTPSDCSKSFVKVETKEGKTITTNTLTCELYTCTEVETKQEGKDTTYKYSDLSYNLKSSYGITESKFDSSYLETAFESVFEVKAVKEDSPIVAYIIIALGVALVVLVIVLCEKKRKKTGKPVLDFKSVFAPDPEWVKENSEE